MTILSALAKRASVLLLALCGVAWAQAPFPNQGMRIILPSPAGGSTDPVAGIIAQKLTEEWGKPVIVDNKPGANTIIGTEALLKAPADGHTLLYTASTHLINSLLVPNLPYDSFKDFQPIASIVRSDFVLVVHPSVPANNLREFIALGPSPARSTTPSPATATPTTWRANISACRPASR